MILEKSILLKPKPIPKDSHSCASLQVDVFEGMACYGPEMDRQCQASHGRHLDHLQQQQ